MNIGCLYYSSSSFPQSVMRRAGANPTDVEILEIVNKIDGESGTFDFPVGNIFVKIFF